MPSTSSAGRTPQLYRVQYFDRPGAFIQGDWNDYVPKDLPAAEAMELRAEAERRHGGKYEFRTVPSVNPKRNDLLHAVCATAKKAGIHLPNLATAPMSALKLAGSYVARATNHGNRLPAVNGILSKDRQGRLTVKMGGAR